MIFIGIDPGKSGAVAFLSDEGLAEVFLCPTIPSGKGTKRLYDVQEMVGLILGNTDGLQSFAVLEKQQAMPKQGLSSTFSIGMGFGIWRGILAALEVPSEEPHSRVWQRVICGSIAGDTKARSIQAASRLFPTIDLRISERGRKPHHGKADALCLAEYARRTYNAGK